MSNKVAVFFCNDHHESKYQGDSIFDGSGVPFQEEWRTLNSEQLSNVFAARMQVVLGETDIDLEAFKDDIGLVDTKVGMWVLDEETHKKITNITVCPGNDSALYAMVAAFKSIIENFAEETIEPQ